MSNGIAVGGAPVTITTTALSKTYQVLTLTGVVPLPMRNVIIGFRFNQEGAGPAPIDLKVYRITYSDGGSTKNRLPNSGFDSGLYKWEPYGTGRVTTPLSDRGDGRMLRLRATASQDIAINSYGIGVKPGSTFRVVVTAELPPAGTTTGYVSAIFLNKTEGWRETLNLVAGPIPSASLVTGGDGSVALDDKLPAGRYLVRLSYSGDATHQAAMIEQQVTVR